MDGHLDCLDLLAITNNTAVYTYKYFVWKFPPLWAVHLGVERLGHIATLCLTF